MQGCVDFCDIFFVFFYSVLVCYDVKTRQKGKKLQYRLPDVGSLLYGTSAYQSM